MNPKKTTKIPCKTCNGTGFKTSSYTGKCFDGKRHEYTFSDGRRSDKCLRCGYVR